MSGTVANGALLDFLRTVATVGSSGRLELRNGDEWARVILRSGRAIAAMTHKTPRLGEMLVEAEVISARELDSLLSLQKRKKVYQPLGMILVQLGVLQFDRLEEYLQRLRARAMAEIIEWEQGDYEFTAEDEGDLWGREPGGVPLEAVLPMPDATA